MRTIHKYPLPLSNGPWPTVTTAPVEMPQGAIPLHFDRQHGHPTLWAEVDTDAPMETRTFVCVGTGHPLRQVGAYVGSYSDGPFVWHIYQGITPKWREWPGDLVGDPPADARGETVVDVDQGGAVWTGPASVVDWHTRCRYRIAAEQPEA